MSALGDAGTRTAKLGRYELITQIGEGGMAEVQLALQRGPAGFEKLVVVKLVHQKLAAQKDFVDMLLDEARVAALLKHPNVVDIYDLGEADGRYFIAMEYLEGEPLLAVLRAGRDGKRLDVLSTARLIADTAEGLDAAHELRSMGGDPIELVHHDVSLGNIVVLYNGQVKLVDFGVAKATQSVSMAASGEPVRVQGKFSYMAPEKLRGNPGDRRSDIWSLGCVLWEALTLKRLFKGGNDADTRRQVLESEIPIPSKINEEVPADLDPIVMRALDRDPATRYQTAKEMATDLEEVLRVHSYGGKNDKIAKYMQATFSTHLEARKRLLQEVSSKGRASASVLEAAFDDSSMLASGSLNRAEFSVRFRPSTLELRPGELAARRKETGHPFSPSPTPTPHPQYPSGTPTSPPLQARRHPTPTPTPLPQVQAQEAEYPRARSEDLPPIVVPADPALTQAAPPLVAPQARAGRRRWILAAVAGAAVVLVIVLVASLGGGGGGEPVAIGAPGADAPPSPDGAVGDPAPDAEATLDAEVSQPPEATDAAIVSDAQGGSDDPASPDSDPSKPKPPKADPAALYRSGLNAYVLGDMKAALSYYRRALTANPGFAIAWRGTGLVHERLGDTRAATAAFQRYLQLAPDAKDAATIRRKIGGGR